MSWTRSWAARFGLNFSQAMPSSLLGLEVPDHPADAAAEARPAGVTEGAALAFADRGHHGKPRQHLRGAAGAGFLHAVDGDFLEQRLVVARGAERKETAVELLVDLVVLRAA